MRAECLPITAIPHATDLFKDYLLHFDKVRDFFPAPPFDPATITDSAKTVDYPHERRVAVAEILERQNKNWGADEKTLVNIERLRSGAHAIVTGHQASLFGGPLFSLLKAISIAKIERELGWRPAESFQSGIRKTIEWYLANATWCEHVRSGEYQKPS